MFGSFCPYSHSIKGENEKGRYQIENTNLEFKIAYSYKDLPETQSKPASLFIDSTYQNLLEEHPSIGMEFIYLPIYENGMYIGTVMAQTTLVKGDESFRIDPKVSGIKGKSQKWLLKNIKLRSFVVGNLLLTGNYGLQFPSKSARESFVIVDIVTKFALPIIEKEKGYKFSIQFYKDFNEEDTAQSSSLLQSGFHCFKGEASMVLEVLPEWKKFEDYLGAMSSKYRVRAKRAFKKGKNLVRKDLSYDQIYFYRKRIHELYRKVCDAADMNLVHLSQIYFPELKKRLKDDFKMIAYFIDGEMVAYFTIINDQQETHAHFLGMENAFNNKHQLYLNILYDIIRVGIESGSKFVDFARTAPEIKSSVGAEPNEMYIFVKHRNTFLNKFVNSVFTYLEPKRDIVYRSPFKSKGTSQTEKVVSSEVKSTPQSAN